MRILGIDTGIAKCGWAITEVVPGLVMPRLVDCGVFQTSPSVEHKTMNAETIERLRQFVPMVEDVLNKYNPDAIIVETVPPTPMAKRDQVVAAQTYFRLIGHHLRYAEMAAVTSKKQFTGDGRAKKKDMKEKCLALYPEVKDKGFKSGTWDAYDAIAISFNAQHLPNDAWWTPVEDAK